MADTVDLKQVGALFDNCIQRIRNQSLGNGEKAVAEWLQKARYDLMRQIEAQ